MVRHKRFFWNVYTNPNVKGEFIGNQHDSLEDAEVAAAHELKHEPKTKLVARLYGLRKLSASRMEI